MENSKPKYELYLANMDEFIEFIKLFPGKYIEEVDFSKFKFDFRIRPIEPICD